MLYVFSNPPKGQSMPATTTRTHAHRLCGCGHKVHSVRARLCDNCVRRNRRWSGERCRAVHYGAFVENVDRGILLVRDKGACGVCKLPLSLSDCHLEHYEPLARGGEHSEGNCTLAHAECNLAKGARDPEEFVPSWEWRHDPHRPVWMYMGPDEERDARRESRANFREWMRSGGPTRELGIDGGLDF